MKFWLCGWMLAALPASGQIPPGAAPVPVTVYTQFEHAPADMFFEALQEELTEVMQPAGIGFAWRGLDTAGREVSVELVVVNFRGDCSIDAPVPPVPPDGPLGRTHASNGEVLPFTEVDCDRLRGFLAKATGAGPDRHSAFGRAAARVLAHEFFHVFTRARLHGTAGIAKAALTAAELLNNRFSFDDQDIRRLRSSQVKLALHASAPVEADGGGQ